LDENWHTFSFYEFQMNHEKLGDVVSFGDVSIKKINKCKYFLKTRVYFKW